MNVETVTAIIAALGGAAIIPKLIDFYKTMKSGKAAEEKRHNRSALGRLVAAEERADDESAYRRIIQEYASTLRRLLIEHGFPESRLPPYPVRPTREKV